MHSDASFTTKISLKFSRSVRFISFMNTSIKYLSKLLSIGFNLRSEIWHISSNALYLFSSKTHFDSISLSIASYFSLSYYSLHSFSSLILDSLSYQIFSFFSNLSHLAFSASSYNHFSSATIQGSSFLALLTSSFNLILSSLIYFFQILSFSFSIHHFSYQSSASSRWYSSWHEKSLQV